MLPKITIPEAKCIDARITGELSFHQLEIEDRRMIAHELICHICAITGAEVPPNEVFSNALVEEFEIFILDYGFKILNQSEILTAFRLNAAGTKYPNDTEVKIIYMVGLPINITSIGRVLENYMQIRNAIDARCRNLVNGVEL